MTAHGGEEKETINFRPATSFDLRISLYPLARNLRNSDFFFKFPVPLIPPFHLHRLNKATISELQFSFFFKSREESGNPRFISVYFHFFITFPRVAGMKLPSVLSTLLANTAVASINNSQGNMNNSLFSHVLYMSNNQKRNTC